MRFESATPTDYIPNRLHASRCIMSDKLPAALHPYETTAEFLDEIAELTARTGGYDGDVF